MRIQMQDGSIAEFPDDMSTEEIQAVVADYGSRNETQKELSANKENTPVETWGDVAEQAVTNFPSSAMQMGKDIYEAFRHPVDTAKSLFDIGAGIIQLAIPEEQPNEEQAKAVGRFFADRYGGVENIKQTLAKDPAGVIADFSTVLSGGGTAMARMPSVVGKAGRVAQTVGANIDPLSATAKLAKGVAKGVGKVGSTLGGITTGVGNLPIDVAYQAGKKGSPQFLSNLRGAESSASVIGDANAEMSRLAQKRLQNYRLDAKRWKGDKTKLDFNPILATWSDEMSTLKDRGHSLIGDAEARKVDEISAVLDEWIDDPTTHDARGFDALKMRLDAIDINADKFGQADRVRTALRNEVKNLIVDKVPSYADAMKAYEDALINERELKKTFTLDRNALTDTTLRKMQSVMRNNVNTNYGRRGEMMRGLDRSGEIMEKLAGQSLNDLSPRSLQKFLAGGTAVAGVGDPVYLLGLPAQSPRLVGESAYALGAGRRKLRDVARKAKITPKGARNIGRLGFQSGRAKGVLEQ